MGVLIPDDFMHIIQPVFLTGGVKNWSVTYAVHKGSSTNTPQVVLNQADTDFRAAFRPLLDTSMSFMPAVGYYQPLGGGPLMLLTSAVAAQPGLAARNSPPPQVATCIRKRTAFVGKAYRGRIFMPGLLDETTVDEDGIITGAGVIAIQAKADIWLASRGVSNSGGLWLLHSKDIGIPNPPNPVTALLVQPIVRTQRRRLPRG